MNKSQQVELMKKICEFIKCSSKEPQLKDLSQKFDLSPYHLQRVFKEIMGLTPKQYYLNNQQQAVRSLLTKDINITKAIYGSGHTSTSRFYEKSTQTLGMTPKEYKNGGLEQSIMVAIGQAKIGSILVARSSKGICEISIGNDAQQLMHDIEDKFPKAKILPSDKEFDELVSKVVGFIESPSVDTVKFDLPLDIKGTVFQQKVWKVLQNIPPGQTVTYSEIAQIIGQPKSFRAVANACGANNLAVLIPCHRVVPKTGGLGGYKWGVEKKKMLIESEAILK